MVVGGCGGGGGVLDPFSLFSRGGTVQIFTAR